MTPLKIAAESRRINENCSFDHKEWQSAFVISNFNFDGKKIDTQLTNACMTFGQNFEDESRVCVEFIYWVSRPKPLLWKVMTSRCYLLAEERGIHGTLNILFRNKTLLHFVAFFHVASLFSTGVDNKKVGVDNEKALELTNSTVFHRGRQ